MIYGFVNWIRAPLTEQYCCKSSTPCVVSYIVTKACKIIFELIENNSGERRNTIWRTSNVFSCKNTVLLIHFAKVQVYTLSVL